MHLPQEIVEEIFDHFGVQQSDDYEKGIREHCVNRMTLASLCRASRHFNATATPLLYRHVRLFNGDIRFFTRTVILNLEIRQMVKMLSLEFELPGTWEEPEEIPEETRARVPSFGEEQWDYECCLGKTSSLLGLDAAIWTGVRGADSPISSASDKLNFDEKPEEDLAATLLFILPELRYLQIKFDPMTDYLDPDSAGYWRCDMLLQTLRLPHYAKRQDLGHVNNHDLQKVIPASLYNLEELVMCNPFESPGWVKRSYPPIVFCPLDEMQPFWGLPNLKSLTLERAAWKDFDQISPIIASSVENLKLLDTAVQPSQLPQLLQHFPSLRSITYALADMYSLNDRDYTPLFSSDMTDKNRIEEFIKSCNLQLENITIKGIGEDDL